MSQHLRLNAVGARPTLRRTARASRYYGGFKEGVPVDLKGTIALTPVTEIGRRGMLMHLIMPKRTWQITAQTVCSGLMWEQPHKAV